MFYIPGLTASGQHRSPVFPYVSPLSYLDGTMTGTNQWSKSLRNDKMSDRFLYSKHFQSQNDTKYKKTPALTELVDIFPTLAALAGLPAIPLCPKNSSSIILCTEGTSLVPVINRSIFNQSKTFKWKSAVFSQYPRPSDFPTANSDQPKLKDIKIVGYTMSNESFRYTEWIGFDPVSFESNWNDVHARELYLHRGDALEMNNVAGFKEFNGLVNQLSWTLKEGWREALPGKKSQWG